jgi:integrase/recombinase XerD
MYLNTRIKKSVVKKKNNTYAFNTAKYWIKGRHAMKQAKTLTAPELRRVLDYIATRKYAARNRAMLLMTHLAGMRVGEVASLRYRDVINTDKTVRAEILLTAEQTKSNEARTVYINERLRKELTTYIQSQRFSTHPRTRLFGTQKRTIDGFSANSLAQYFHHLYKGAGIAGASSHSGRRSFITNLASKGVGVRVIMGLSGHRALSSVQHYIDCSNDMKRRAVELV